MMLFPDVAANAAPADFGRVPFASSFDLASFIIRPTSKQVRHQGVSRWLTEDIEPPPGPPRDPPIVKIRGKKVKFRMRF
ncbi:hypothetical protein HZF05_18795 [Sphingomonas sp. CGMCC 1.13654]|uniref:Uncharacterized protein n=1 Tax=Sphingomonas chungangi TaxID=2683589 RepID=A0A838LBP5_9SPHN|nr:hypothetical protein [Sphingomonas chungangi]MBA2936135.1 hypothetical protein [Sphingomonas chungangi]MVW55521.1 hypothetical protein [Sphingomonas chungangi]